MKDMQYFKIQALARNLCRDYVDQWANCLNDKDKLLRLVLKPQSISYFALSMQEGWGVDKEYIKIDFEDYINGKYICENIIPNVSGELFCDFEFDNYFDLKANQNLLIGCKGEITVNEVKFLGINACQNTNITLIPCDYSIIEINIFDNSVVDLQDVPENSRINVNLYGKKAKILNASKNVTVKNRDIKVDAFGYKVNNIK